MTNNMKLAITNLVRLCRCYDYHDAFDFLSVLHEAFNTDQIATIGKTVKATAQGPHTKEVLELIRDQFRARRILERGGKPSPAKFYAENNNYTVRLS